ncbi:MAG: hypothetical protein ACXW32_15305, partial [Limisphaerales bacterium]
MSFPQFWVKERGSVPGGGWRGKFYFECWGWSNISLADAQKLALEKAERIALHFRGNQKPPDQYSYGTRALREQVLRTIHDENGHPFAIVTRNQHGCVVLNTDRAMFVDIDFDEPNLPQNRIVSFFRKAKLQEPSIEPELTRVEQWTNARKDWAWRIYRTRAGLRLLATHAMIRPSEAAPIFQELGADPLYQKLCANQDSFRARLTPKPWLLNISKVPATWPWPDPAREAAFQKWEQKYLAKSVSYSTCRFIKAIGSGKIHSALEPVIEIHDQATQAHSGLELA